MVVTRRVKPGHEAQFEELVSQIAAEARKFKGHLATEVFRPTPSTPFEYQLVSKFDCMSNMRHWQESDERLRLYARIEPLLEDAPQIQWLTGLETWFTLPGHPAVAAPPRYKMAIVSWLAIFPLVVVILEVFGTLLGEWPLPVRALFITAIAIPTMTYVLMPRMTRIFAGWLYPKLPKKSQS